MDYNKKQSELADIKECLKSVEDDLQEIEKESTATSTKIATLADDDFSGVLDEYTNILKDFPDINDELLSNISAIQNVM
jgi:hypothetical protein